MYNFYVNAPAQPQFALVKDLAEYIVDETKDSRYYEILAGKAPTQRAKDLLLSFSQDEKGHANDLKNLYFTLTGKRFVMPKIQDPVVPDYETAIKDRIMAETHDYEKYGNQYIKPYAPFVKNLFYKLRTNEAQHAMKMPILFHEK